VVHGAYALRWIIFADGSLWVSSRFGTRQLDDVVRRFILTIWNTHVFFTTYARIDGFDPAAPAPAVPDRPVMDRWVLAELADTIAVVDEGLATYDVTSATRRLEGFVDDLSNWYVRRGRRRFWRAAEDDPADKAAAFHTLHTCLTVLARLLAPFTPFLAERLWQDLVVAVVPDAADSVHLTEFPTADPAWPDPAVRAARLTGRRLVELGRQARTDAGLRIRQPLARALVAVPPGEAEGLRLVAGEVSEELNIHAVELADASSGVVDRRLRPAFRTLGPAFGPAAPAVAAALAALGPTETGTLLATVAAEGSATLTVAGAARAVTSAMYEVVEDPRVGWAVVGDGSRSVALDTALTPELEREGAARELVRAVNELRRERDLALDDRITLRVHLVPAELGDALAAAGLLDLVARESLATALEVVPHADLGAAATTVELGALGSAVLDLARR
jgi:isoleucyl-tRNA synthetase